MTTQDIAAAMQRVKSVLQRRPEAGLHDDAPAEARWQGGSRVVTSDPGGTEIATDLPGELGGSGAKVSPGWLFRAALASCAATRIAMEAAAQGIELGTLAVLAGSRSDARGLLGIEGAGGEPVAAGPLDIELVVRISAPGVAPERLRALVEAGHRLSPVADSARRTLPVALRIEVDTV